MDALWPMVLVWYCLQQSQIMMLQARNQNEDGLKRAAKFSRWGALALLVIGLVTAIANLVLFFVLEAHRAP